MKRRFSIPFSLLLLSLFLLTACSGKSSENDSDNSGASTSISAPAEYEEIAQIWNSALKASAQGDCETFLTLFTTDPTVDDSDCEAAFSFLKGENWEIDWEASEWNADKSKVKVYLTNGRILSTFEKKAETEVWGIDMRFWED